MKYANFSFLSSEKVNGSMNLHLLWSHEYCQKEQNTLWDESRRFCKSSESICRSFSETLGSEKDLLEEISEKALD